MGEIKAIIKNLEDTVFLPFSKKDLDDFEYEDLDLQDTYIYACLNYLGATRRVKDEEGLDRPYLIHPVGVEQILESVGADIETRQLGLLHDILEENNNRPREDILRDTIKDKVLAENIAKTFKPATYQSIANLFGVWMADDVRILTNVKAKGKKISERRITDKEAEYLDELFDYAKGENPLGVRRDRIIKVKLADKIHSSTPKELEGLSAKSLFSICAKNIYTLHKTEEYMETFDSSDESLHQLNTLYRTLYALTEDGIVRTIDESNNLLNKRLGACITLGHEPDDDLKGMISRTISVYKNFYELRRESLPNNFSDVITQGLNINGDDRSSKIMEIIEYEIQDQKKKTVQRHSSQ